MIIDNINRQEILVQILEENDFNFGKLYKLKQNWLLHLKLSNNIIHKRVRVFCNLPKTIDDEFVREKYYEYEWQTPQNSLNNDDFDKFIEINCNRTGAFDYYFTFNSDDERKFSKGGSNFLIDPQLCFHSGKQVNVNSLQIQTVLTKLLGPLDEWKSRLIVAKETGYNMIHFTPIQELSNESNSSYCLKDNLKLMKTADPNGKFNMNDLERVIDSIYKEWNMFSICDLVYNHMANDAEFLQKCPQSTYNLDNSRHLIPAFVLDRILYHITLDIGKGLYEPQGISRDQFNDYNIETLRHIIRHQEIPKYRLEEFFTIDLNKTLNRIKEIGLGELNNIEKNLNEFKNQLAIIRSMNKEQEWNKLKIIQDSHYRRLMSSIDEQLVKNILKVEFQHLNLSQDIKNSNDNSQLIVNIYERFCHELNKQNERIKHTIYSYLDEAANNVVSNTYYHFIAHDGPKWRKVTKDQPIVRTYFYFPFDDTNAKNDELVAFDKTKNIRIQAHNGWVMGDDPLKNFASKESNVYFRRQLIPWGDSVKLRYGNGPSDNPELWNYMAEYTKITAQIFHGVRLDNCHSTPLNVAQYYLDLARSIRPNLYVIAELFTNSEQIDNKFVTELGITSLIREALNAWNSNELGRLVHRFGGKPVGSFYQHRLRPLQNDTAHAIFYDVTHDNKSLIKVHSTYDTIATSSLVLMSGCATGSTRGFDELVPEEINVVTESRPYMVWDPAKKTPNSIGPNDGILKIKKAMNNLHFEMGELGFSELYVDQFDNDTTVVTRHNPQSRESFILIARTSFSNPSNHTNNNLSRPLVIPSKIDSIIFESNIVEKNQKDFKESKDFINGLENFELQFNQNVKESKFIHHIDYDGNTSHVHFKYFPPGTVMVFKVVLNQVSAEKLPFINENILKLISKNGNSDIDKIFESINFEELNILLFRCGNEEASEQIGSSVYDIPGHGPLVYCGLQGIMNVLEKQRLYNNLGHGLFENLRSGDWLMDYITSRLKKYHDLKPTMRPNLLELSKWLNDLFKALQKMPRYLLPFYFDLVITGLYIKAIEKSWSLMSNNKNSKFSVSNGSSFVRALALAGVSLVGHLRDSPLPDTLIDHNRLALSMSAGLPHFSTSYMRNWGRDTFISIRGLLLLLNRQDDAKDLILSYGSCLRHGLIPNLLGEGKFARYNARDSVWWWLKAIRDYCEIYGTEILSEYLYRLYPTDDAQYPNEHDLKHKSTGPNKQKLFDVIQEALTVHLRGLKFRERNAGYSIDEHMQSDGFNNEIGVDLETGFVYGGNRFNCGTWMDKMGSSEKASNKGWPATPRDGSAVELVGLSRHILDWLINTNKQSKYPYDGAILDENTGTKFTWVQWAQKIDDNFEKHFWVDQSSTESRHINKRNIYKDTYKSSLEWPDYQFRPNFLVALALAPQMINKEHAKLALEQVKNNLMNEPNQLGIKTLDASDFNYCGYYDNSNDSMDKNVSHGFNYHQGPEWLWPVGYYLRALLFYSKDDLKKKNEAVLLAKQHFGKLYTCLNSNDWKSLPELTNKNGQECYYSCTSQAWSLATILETINDLDHLN
jgi:glycogen debranching enzyme